MTRNYIVEVRVTIRLRLDGELVFLPTYILI